MRHPLTNPTFPRCDVTELFVSPTLLAIFFFVVSATYSSVGLGGGTSYTALLAIFGAGHRSIPPISLTLNIVVTLMASINFVRGGHLRPSLVAAFVITSAPMAYLGGSLDVDARSFQLILIGLLIVVAARIYLWRRPAIDLPWSTGAKIAVSLFIGAIWGLVSGVVGIGGGIFLVPLIILLGLGDQKEAAATGAVFILLNSTAALSAHAQRHMPPLSDIAPLVFAVIAGGFLGSYLSSEKLEKATIQKILGTIIVIAAVLLSLRL